MPLLDFVEDLKSEIWMYQSARQLNRVQIPDVLAAFVVIACTLRNVLIEKTVCARFGHNWIDQSMATPDWGVDQGYCQRCGWGYRVIMY
jgi:hypothetical protein